MDSNSVQHASPSTHNTFPLKMAAAPPTPFDHPGLVEVQGIPTLSKTEAAETEEEAHSEQKRGVVAAARIRSVITQRDIHIAYAA